LTYGTIASSGEHYALEATGLHATNTPKGRSNHMGKLQNKIAVITGGNSGIGLATAEEFVAEGAYVYITGRRQKQLNDAVEKIGGNVTAVQGDISEPADLDRLYAQIAKEKGRIDILFANAGKAGPVALGEITERQFDEFFDVNVRGTLFTVQKALPLMSKGGVVLLCGSNTTEWGAIAHTLYSATKAAVRSFARTWTMELKDRQIRVNVISPGPIDTPIWETSNLPSEVVAQIKREIVSKVPAGEIGNPADVAKTALFMVSEDSRFIRGVELFVDGGMVSA
jgi:NAD(P)-dependent dehydrogenase (short-subunit alcohol dehydrogenase family)